MVAGITGKFKTCARSLFVVSCIVVVLTAAGCVMAARKGAQKVEERDGPVGHLLNETKEELHPGSGQTPDEQP